MITISNGEWIADLTAMTCQNVLNKVIVCFEKKGKFPLGKIKNMPMDLFIKLAVDPHGEKKMAKLVIEAQDVFFRAFIESDFERQSLMYKDLKDI